MTTATKLLSVGIYVSRTRWFWPLVGLVHVGAMWLGFKLAAQPGLHWSVPFAVLSLPPLLLVMAFAAIRRALPD